MAQDRRRDRGSTYEALVRVVLEHVGSLTREQAEAVVTALFDAIVGALARGETVRVAGFGTFAVGSPKPRAARGRSKVEIPVRFRAAQSLCQGVLASPAAGRGQRPRLRPPVSPGGGRSGGRHRLDDEEPARSPPAAKSLEPDRRPGQRSRFCEVRVFYATDRGPVAGLRGYGSRRGDGTLRYGTCRVSVPEDRRLGALPGPSVLRLELRADPRKHVILRSVEELPRASFLQHLRRVIGSSPGRQALVFLHGFNVRFEDAARRTAQIAYDLQFPGAPIFYSWPSHGHLLSYLGDGNNAEWSTPHFVRFLRELTAETGAERIHLIAHSMGNRVLMRALHEVVLAQGRAAPIFHEVILTAPDIDAEVFRQLAEAVVPHIHRATLYASANDKALKMSKRLNGFPRAGDAGNGLVILPPMETIDASAVDTSLLGHSYFGDCRSVLADLYYLMKDGLGAAQRFGLRPHSVPGGRFWVLGS